MYADHDFVLKCEVNLTDVSQVIQELQPLYVTWANFFAEQNY